VLFSNVEGDCERHGKEGESGELFRGGERKMLRDKAGAGRGVTWAAQKRNNGQSGGAKQKLERVNRKL